MRRKTIYNVEMLDENGVWQDRAGDTIYCENLTEAKKEVKKIVKNGGDARIYYETQCDVYDEGYSRGVFFYDDGKFWKQDLTDI